MKRLKRIEDNQRKRQKKSQEIIFVAHDKITLPKRSGTLGSNLYALSNQFNGDDNRSKYLKSLSLNGILDISSSGQDSQVGKLDLSLSSNVMKKLKTTVTGYEVDITQITDLTKFGATHPQVTHARIQLY
ncbi:hypothetical protein BDB00DRAFT_784020 [Zychaea mexicana]|uniref:uncharacterized protein n=1 Tax=Zychaea mexicana TaxID=64656 RepID=UPI0022FE229E|nr:uncharacterized protein BDB00DRAFT_784019 [Zychaea mexicana]XP_052984673.1 uncharacterized protein BDB00DRAFT_784020 [Zychaea mexicana]KAI9498407.1 hypothetical protein BDB00DRAFT_784019 [Zychaea mexicana]KAI9498408.1 hypothetical protein BDB00DRAFT_784020 [Zychaea mexicana]